MGLTKIYEQRFITALFIIVQIGSKISNNRGLYCTIYKLHYTHVMKYCPLIKNDVYKYLITWKYTRYNF